MRVRSMSMGMGLLVEATMDPYPDPFKLWGHRDKSWKGGPYLTQRGCLNPLGSRMAGEQAQNARPGRPMELAGETRMLRWMRAVPVGGSMVRGRASAECRTKINPRFAKTTALCGESKGRMCLHIGRGIGKR